MITVYVERFAGVNVRGFNPIEVFVKIPSKCLLECLLFSIIKERRAYIHVKPFAALLKSRKFTPANLSMFKVYSLSRAWGVG